MYSVVTHDGRFHSDDIFGVAVLQLRFGVENIKVTRTREQSLVESADIVFDVGGEYDPARRRFDHHQAGAPVRENGLPYAAFGLLWKQYGEEIAGSKEIVEKIDKKLAQPIDAGDNGMALYKLNQHGVAPVELYDFLESFMPPIGSDDDPDVAFMKAVEVARGYLERVIERARVKEWLKVTARKVYEATEDKTVLVFDAPMKRDIFIDYPEVKIVVSPDETHSKWYAVGVPTSDGSFETRATFPEAWAGLEGEALASASSIPGAIFCHKNRFMCVTKTKEAAIAAAIKAVS